MNHHRKPRKPRRQHPEPGLCREVYRETAYLYERIARRAGRDDGFQILLGPPTREPLILFLGFQPGAAKDCKSALEERAYGSERGWPAKSEYVTEGWRLARNLRAMFDCDWELLNQCVGMNAVFIRSKTIDDYRAIQEDVRRDIEAFCLLRVKRIIEAVQPRTIMVIGIETLGLFGRGEPVLVNGRGRTLAMSGKVAGRPAVGVLHLSGARISTDDRTRIKQQFGRAMIRDPSIIRQHFL